MRRKNSLRLAGYDYAQSGGYYVTICTHEKTQFLSTVVDGTVVLSAYGEIVRACWLKLPEHYDHLRLDMFVIMPNHMHAIMLLVDDERALKNDNTNDGDNVGEDLSSSPTKTPKRHSISEMIRAFKSFSSRDIKRIDQYNGNDIWQRGFYDHIIRNEDDLRRIQQYIIENPLKWEQDEYYG